MSPVIQATIALNFSTLVGVLAGYYLRKAFETRHECPTLVRVPRGSRGTLTLSGACELGERFVSVEDGGEFTVTLTGDGNSLAPGTHDLSGVTLEGKP